MSLVTKHQELPSQTAGPYVHIGCIPQVAGLDKIYGGIHLGSQLVNEDTKGKRITISGKIYDGVNTPLKDGIVEIWQADHKGLFPSINETRGVADQNFTGWGRQPTSLEDGSFKFETIKPGRIPSKQKEIFHAPHVNFWIAARGINIGLHTKMYFPEEEHANVKDPILSRLEHQSRVYTLISEQLSLGCYEFNIYLQGDKETIFFDV